MSFPILYPVLIQFSIKAPQTRFSDLFLWCVPAQEERAFVNSEKPHDACFFLHAYTSGKNPVQEGSVPWRSIHGSCYAHRYQLKDVRYAGNHSDLPGHGALYARLRQLRRWFLRGGITKLSILVKSGGAVSGSDKNKWFRQKPDPPDVPVTYSLGSLWMMKR